MILLLTMISPGVLYFVHILSPQLDKIQALKETSRIKKAQIQSLEERVDDLPQLEEELIYSRLEIQGLKNKIPRHETAITMMMELLKYMDAHDFKDTEIAMGQLIKQEDQINSYKTLPMRINYTTSYSNAAKMLEKISRSYSMVTMDQFSIDNSIQDERDDLGKPKVTGEYVRAHMLLSLYYIEGEREEHYPNFMEYLSENDKVFSRQREEEVIGQD